jgi:glycosyltransferase involved in cell wall biosynthesis
MGKRILFILHTPPPINGAAMVGQFIKGSEVIKGSFDADFINLTTSFSLNSIGKSDIRKYFTVLQIQAKILKALNSRKYDLCYMSFTAKGAGFYKDLFVVAVLKLFRKNIIYHFHNKGVAQNSKNSLNKILYRAAFNNTRSILLSSHLYYDIASYVKKADVYFCANGIPATNGDKTIIQNKDQPCKLLFLSNMMVEKGVLILLEACKRLKDRNLSFECHFVGAWSDVTEEFFLDSVQKHNLTEYVFGHGKKYNEDKLSFFHQASVFVFPTFYHNECFPLVLLEALEHSLPIVSTPEGGIPDIVIDGETGFLVPQQNIEALTERLSLLIQQPTLRIQMGSAGRKRYEELFTLAKFEQNLTSILENAIAVKLA